MSRLFGSPLVESVFSPECNFTCIPYDCAWSSGYHGTGIVEACLSRGAAAHLQAIANASTDRLHHLIFALVAVTLRKYSGDEEVLFRVLADNPNCPQSFRVTFGTRTDYRDIVLQLHSLSSQAKTQRPNENDRSLNSPSGVICSIKFDATDIARDLGSDLMLAFVPTDDLLKVTAAYNTGLYHESTIRTLLRRMDHLSLQLTRTPEEPIDNIELSDSHDLSLIEKLSRPRTLAIGHLNTINRLLDRQFMRADATPAIVFEHTTLSYQALKDCVNGWALRLRELGIGRNKIVAIIADRSLEMVASAISVIRSGAAYLPLDPGLPLERIVEILDLAGCQFVLSTPGARVEHKVSAIKERLGANAPQVIDFSLRRNVQGNFDEWLDDSCPADLAYVMFTSGSTGTPMGVKITHAAVANLYFGLRTDVYNYEHRHLRFGLVSPFSFDASIKQIFGALLDGHTLCVAASADCVSGRRLLEFGNRQSIDVVDGTPAYLRELDRALSNSPTLPFRFHHLVIGGEHFPVEIAARLEAKARRPLRFTNVYGPTECCDVSTSCEISPTACVDRSRAPIGRAIPNVSISIVGEQGRRSPPGVFGEIWISGPGVSAGYLGGSGDQARFVEELADVTSISFKTRDLGRWLPDGTIELAGRIDRCAKINGARVEPREVELQIETLPMVTEAAVVARTDKDANCFLVGFVATDCLPSTHRGRIAFAPQDDVIETIRCHLAGRLPAYMIPRHIYLVPSLPKLSSGKVDLNALGNRPAEQTNKPKRRLTELEITVGRMWAEINEVPFSSVSLHTSFFDIGGNSLRALVVTDKLTSELRVPIEITSLLRHPTLAEFSAHIAGASIECPPTDDDCIISIRRCSEPANRSLFWIHDSLGNVAQLSEISSKLPPNISCFGLVPSSRRVLSPINTTIESLAESYAQKILKHADAVLLGGWSLGATIAYETARYLECNGLKLKALAMLDPTPVASRPSFSERFSRNGELSLVTEIADKTMTDKLHHCQDTEELWQTVVEQLIRNDDRSDQFIQTFADRVKYPLRLERDIATNLRLINMWRSLTRAHLAYQPTQGVSVPIFLILAKHSGDCISGSWKQFGNLDLTVRSIPGDHFSMLTGNAAQLCADILTERVDAD
jgi:amino acid adenylation domain-containing protein